MHGENPIRPPEKGDGRTLKVQEMFPTLQGEGPYVGVPAIFIRLGGCNLACHFCDTEFESFEELSIDAILAQVEALREECAASLIVLTGGEPLRQNVAPLCEALLAQGLKIQIETNGTLMRPLPEAVEIICSPKMSDGNYHPVRDDLLARCQGVKFIVSASDALYRDVLDVGQSAHNVPTYVQPMDEGNEAKNKANRAHAVELCMKHGYRLSLQTHKILGIE